MQELAKSSAFQVQKEIRGFRPGKKNKGGYQRREGKRHVENVGKLEEEMDSSLDEEEYEARNRDSVCSGQGSHESFLGKSRSRKHSRKRKCYEQLCSAVIESVHELPREPHWQAALHVVKYLKGNLINLDAAACLCTAVHANVALKALVNYCDRDLPNGFQCPPRRHA
uniref:Hydrophobic seed protein domain-containing protein n=1 Tax=Chenopodium quinoa TaxID=63459 RepID=A0A803MQJ8_CHEQI